MDGLIVENHGDIPFAKPDQLGPETAAVHGGDDRPRAARACGVPVGINVLANARACRRSRSPRRPARGFVRVNQWANAYVANEGFIEGPAGSRDALPGLAAAPADVTDLRRRPRQARRARHHRRPQHRRAHPRRRVLRRRRAPSPPASAPATARQLDELRDHRRRHLAPGAGRQRRDRGQCRRHPQRRRRRDRRELAEARRRLVERGRSRPGPPRSWRPPTRRGRLACEAVRPGPVSPGRKPGCAMAGQGSWARKPIARHRARGRAVSRSPARWARAASSPSASARSSAPASSC